MLSVYQQIKKIKPLIVTKIQIKFMIQRYNLKES